MSARRLNRGWLTRLALGLFDDCISGDLADPIPEPEEPGAPLLPPLSVPAQAAFSHTASRLQAWDGGSALIRDEFEVSNALNVALHLERLASASVPTCLQTEGCKWHGARM